MVRALTGPESVEPKGQPLIGRISRAAPPPSPKGVTVVGGVGGGDEEELPADGGAVRSRESGGTGSSRMFEDLQPN
ncbi:hypothetical protein EBO15_08085 [Actinomadura harenae]|uniref:Uncharacterized protein n=1 Tax=Actinomadura harenae TaxID=2483351 RepID=A0A3M2M9D6_9ACTN|nr:hypothetical protein EBO15_08085 [Actinomadura harenae]